MSEQPKALRLADMVLSLRSHLGPWRDESDPDEQAAWDGYTEAAAELRRLHALCEEMGDALESIVECCEEDRCARDYASRQTEIRGISRAALAKWKESK